MNHQTHESLSLRARLQALAERVPEQGIRVQELIDSLGRDGLLLFTMLLSLPFLIPVQIPGVSTVFGALILIFGIAATLNLKPWLPRKLADHQLSREKLVTALEHGAKWVQRVEKFSRPRLAAFVGGPMQRVNGALLVVGALLLMVPLGLVPFSNTLPGLALIFTANGMLTEDGFSVLVGIGFVALTVIYFAALAAFGVAAVMQMLPFLQ